MSKPETNYPLDLVPTTNHPYRPSSKTVLCRDIVIIPEGVHYIPEIVINGLNQDAVESNH